MWLALLPLLVVLSPRPAGAHERAVRFEWSAPEGCPPREAVLARAEQLLEGAVRTTAPADLQLEAHVTIAGSAAWRLELLQRSSGGTQARSVQAESCDELADATALFIALSIDPSFRNAPVAPPSASFPAEQAQTTGVPVLPDPGQTPPRAPEQVPLAPTPVEASTRPPRFQIGLSIGMSWGRLPGRATGAVLHGAVSHRSWLWLAELSLFPEQRANPVKGTAGGDLNLLGVGAGIGYLAEFERMSFGPVAGVELGWMRGSGTGIANPTSASVLLLGCHAGLRYGVAVSPTWAVLASGAVTVLANRPRFVLDGIGPVHQPERWGWRASVGAEWRAP